MTGETILYQCDNIKFKGYLATPRNTSPQKNPAILIAHAWRGLDDFAKQKAHALAELGYIAFAADLYGDGITVSNEKAPSLMMPLFLDRLLLRKRINAALDVLQKHPFVDVDSIGAIGFCFGGLTVIELFRSGAKIRGAVSFHGLLGDNFDENHAQHLPIAQGIKGSLLILHGDADPLVSPEDIKNLQSELTKANVDWQMNIYGNVSHAFTNPEARDVEHGFQFNPKASARAWQSMRNFFDELFTKAKR